MDCDFNNHAIYDAGNKNSRMLVMSPCWFCLALGVFTHHLLDKFSKREGDTRLLAKRLKKGGTGKISFCCIVRLVRKGVLQTGQVLYGYFFFFSIF